MDYVEYKKANWMKNTLNTNLYKPFETLHSTPSDVIGGFEGFNTKRSSRSANFGKKKEKNKDSCNSVFIKKVEWVKKYTIYNGTRLACPGCETMVGYAKLNGLRCSCGHWQQPGYQLLRNKVKVRR